jgi:hypothetical protein
MVPPEGVLETFLFDVNFRGHQVIMVPSEMFDLVQPPGLLHKVKSGGQNCITYE